MKNKKLTILAAALFVGAVVLLSLSGVGTARAAATARSEVYDAQMRMKSVGVALSENGVVVATSETDEGELTFSNIPTDRTFALNRGYEEVLVASNTGTIDEYIRVILDMYWLNEDGTKVTELAPSYVKPALVNGNYGEKWFDDLAAAGWIIDPNCSYVTGEGEQLIIYYNSAVEPGASTPAICNYLAVDGAIANTVATTRVETEKGILITNTYEYDGVYFAVAAKVDAMQTHNGTDAALSVWGVELTAENGTLSLN